jgi:hypothetical protein
MALNSVNNPIKPIYHDWAALIVWKSHQGEKLGFIRTVKCFSECGDVCVFIPYSPPNS